MARPLARLTSTNKGRTRVISLRGANELRARLGAISGAFEVIGRKWQTEAIAAGRPRIPTRTGRTRASLQRGPIQAKTGKTRLQARVLGHYVAYFIDSGVKPHGPKRASVLAWQGSHGTIFARRVRGYRARPFRARMAREGMRRTSMAQAVVDEWNRAA